MGMRVAEDVDPYKEESNILMRSTLLAPFYLIFFLISQPLA